MRSVCPRFRWVLPLRRSEVLPGHCRLPPPGAVSTEAELRLQSLCPFFPPPEKPGSLTRLPQRSVFRLPSILKSASSLAASAGLSPTPSRRFRHSLASRLVTQHFFQLIGPI